MARWDEERQGRGWEDEERGTQERDEERRWSRASRGQPVRRPEEGDRGTDERSGNERYEREDPERYERGERYGGGNFGGGGRQRSRYDSGSRSESGYRYEARSPYDSGSRSGGRWAEERPESYGETQRWERTRPDGIEPSYGGGAYAGGSFGGGAWGPGGFGGRGYSPSVWEGAAGRGEAPDWTRERERSYRARDYSGRGPRGYQRSNERITEDVCDALTRHPDVDASNISVRCENGEVVLSGTVNDRHEKRLAEDAAERIAGVREVRNEIRLYRPSEEEMEGTMRRGSSEGRMGEDGQEEEQTRRGSSSSRSRTGSNR